MQYTHVHISSEVITDYYRCHINLLNKNSTSFTFVRLKFSSNFTDLFIEVKYVLTAYALDSKQRVTILYGYIFALFLSVALNVSHTFFSIYKHSIYSLAYSYEYV